MRRKKKILFICGSINQTKQMLAIARELPEYDHAFSAYYGNGDFDWLLEHGFLESSIGGHKLRGRCLYYLKAHGAAIDDGGKSPDIDLVYHCSDQVWPHNLDDKKVILVQEGMTDPPGILYWLFKKMRPHFPYFPGWVAGTSAMGLSDHYTKFCVASEGFRQLYASRGVRLEKMIVTGMPNFDDCRRYEQNQFPHRDFVLCCTSDMREVWMYNGWEDRRATIERARRIANGRKLVFKLHPNERLPRAIDEINRWAPEALVYTDGIAEEMVANCSVLICKFSTVAFVGLALGKEVHSSFSLATLRRLMPLQNRRGAKNMARVGRELLGDAPPLLTDDDANGAASQFVAHGVDPLQQAPASTP
jgi:hypothetical protein